METRPLETDVSVERPLDYYGVHNLQSSVPGVCLEEECFMGIDEAGRGPVLGPMVYGACYCPLSWSRQLEERGFADSKTLTEEKREDLFKKIGESGQSLGWKTDVLSPNYISNAMLSVSKYNLNAISHDTAIGLIRKVMSDGVRLAEVYIDTVGPPEKYQDKLSRLFPQLKITVSKKADSLFPIVSAASICAKVVRDRVLNQWTFIENGLECGTDFGSGYPSDPQTKEWLSARVDPVFGYPSIVRFSWSTSQEHLDSKALGIAWPDNEDGSKDFQAAAAGSAKISQFFAPKPCDSPLARHRFFKERGLKPFLH